MSKSISYQGQPYVPQDQNTENAYLSKTGGEVHVWSAWVTDKPKGCHEYTLPGRSLISSLVKKLQISDYLIIV